MQKSLSIFLLSVFLFNIIGYKAVYFFELKQADARIEAKILKSDFSSNRLITLRVPLTLPYLTNSNFESIEGEITVKGTTYKYIKRKIENNTLVFVCIDHYEKSRIQKNSDDYFKKVNDLPAGMNKKPVLKQDKNDFFEYATSYKFCDFQLINLQASVLKLSELPTGFYELNPPPPEC
ncbi:MAG TPA: hypothetical protein VGB63_05575 [Pedobacter sp.]